MGFHSPTIFMSFPLGAASWRLVGLIVMDGHLFQSEDSVSNISGPLPWRFLSLYRLCDNPQRVWRKKKENDFPYKLNYLRYKAKHLEDWFLGITQMSCCPKKEQFWIYFYGWRFWGLFLPHHNNLDCSRTKIPLNFWFVWGQVIWRYMQTHPWSLVWNL